MCHARQTSKTSGMPHIIVLFTRGPSRESHRTKPRSVPHRPAEVQLGQYFPILGCRDVGLLWMWTHVNVGQNEQGLSTETTSPSPSGTTELHSVKYQPVFIICYCIEGKVQKARAQSSTRVFLLQASLLQRKVLGKLRDCQVSVLHPS